MSTFYDLTIENSKNEKLQKYRIILSTYLLFTKMIAPFKYFQVPLAKAIFFYKVPNYLQAQNNILSHLMGWLSWIKFIWKWVIPLTWLVGDGESRLPWFYMIRNFLENEGIFPGCPTNELSHLCDQSAPYN